MIDFGNFYSLIAKNHLSHWLETLPAQIANWQREQQHGLFKQWSNAVEFLPEIKPYRLDLLHSVTAESEGPLSAGQIKRIETLMRNLMPWRKGPFSLYGVNIDTEWRSDWKNGIAFCPDPSDQPYAPFWMSAAAAVITCGA